MKKLNNILLVDDNHFNNQFNKNLIEELGIASHINIANNGSEAISILKKGERDRTAAPELILLDIVMPEMDGIEFIKSYEQMDPQLSKSKIVILTAVGTDTNLSKLYTLGISDIINKPLTKENLMNVLEKYFPAH